jgi:isopentenyl-diphosphate Delta-isomerase
MTGSELVDVISESDNVLETRTLEDCLRLGLLHRAVTVFVRRSNGDIFLQQRSKKDDWLPGFWTASCTGHVKSGEDAGAGAARELKEELGIKCFPRFILKFIVPRIRYLDKNERELNYVFEAISDEPIAIDKAEIEQGMFLGLEECKTFFRQRREEITLDARIAFERYLSAMDDLPVKGTRSDQKHIRNKPE